MHLAFVVGNEVYIVPTKLLERKDVNSTINDRIDYKYCGFNSKLSSYETDIANEGLQAMIWEDLNGYKEIYYLQ